MPTPIQVNMDYAKRIKRAKLREDREPLFKEADAKFMRALEDNNTEDITRLKTIKQQLRDITAVPEIEAAETEAQLRAIRPSVLDEDI